MEYISQFTMYDFLTIYCAGMLCMILMVVSMGILMMIILAGLDIISDFWYTIKVKRTKHRKMEVV